MSTYISWSERQRETVRKVFLEKVTDLLDDLCTSLFKDGSTAQPLNVKFGPGELWELAAQKETTSRVTILFRHGHSSCGTISIGGIHSDDDCVSRELVMNHLQNLQELEAAARSLAEGHLVRVPDKSGTGGNYMYGECYVDLSYRRENTNLPFLPKNGIQAKFALEISDAELRAFR